MALPSLQEVMKSGGSTQRASTLTASDMRNAMQHGGTFAGFSTNATSGGNARTTPPQLSPRRASPSQLSPRRTPPPRTPPPVSPRRASNPAPVGGTAVQEQYSNMLHTAPAEDVDGYENLPAHTIRVHQNNVRRDAEGLEIEVFDDSLLPQLHN